MSFLVHIRIARNLILVSLIFGYQYLYADINKPATYIFDDTTWLEPFAGIGRTWGGNSGVQVESKDRIYFLQRGETELPNPIPSNYTNFPASMGVPEWNVLQGRGRVWNNCIYIANSDGEILEVWSQWDYLFHGTEGPGPHRIRINPYDLEKKVWVVDESGHIIYVFSNDGQELISTIGEKNVSGNDKYHLNLPQDVAFLSDGKYIIADGIGNKRIVIRNSDHSYHSEFGEAGELPHQFGSVHSLGFGPNQTLYVVDRINKDLKVYRQTVELESENYPKYQYVDTWQDMGLVLDIIVNDDSLWLTETNPPRLKNYTLNGELINVIELPQTGGNFWIEMHSISVDEDGNLYASDNQAGRPRKLSPSHSNDKINLVKRPYTTSN